MSLRIVEDDEDLDMDLLPLVNTSGSRSSDSSSSPPPSPPRHDKQKDLMSQSQSGSPSSRRASDWNLLQDETMQSSGRPSNTADDEDNNDEGSQTTARHSNANAAEISVSVPGAPIIAAQSLTTGSFYSPVDSEDDHGSIDEDGDDNESMDSDKVVGASDWSQYRQRRKASSIKHEGETHVLASELEDVRISSDSDVESDHHLRVMEIEEDTDIESDISPLQPTRLNEAIPSSSLMNEQSSDESSEASDINESSASQRIQRRNKEHDYEPSQSSRISYPTSLQSDDPLFQQLKITATEDEDDNDLEPPFRAIGIDISANGSPLEYDDVLYNNNMGRLVFTRDQLEFYRYEKLLISIPWVHIVQRHVTPPKAEVPFLNIQTMDENQYKFQLADSDMAEFMSEDIKGFPDANTAATPLRSNVVLEIDDNGDDDDNEHHSREFRLTDLSSSSVLDSNHSIHTEDMTELYNTTSKKASNNRGSEEDKRSEGGDSSVSPYVHDVSSRSFEDTMRFGDESDPHLDHDDDIESAHGSKNKSNSDNNENNNKNVPAMHDKFRQDEVQRRRQEGRMMAWMGLCFALMCLVIGGIAGYFIGRNDAIDGDDNNNNNQKVIVTMAPTIVGQTTANNSSSTQFPGWLSPEEPTVSPSVSPSFFPTTPSPTNRGIPPRMTPQPTTIQQEQQPGYGTALPIPPTTYPEETNTETPTMMDTTLGSMEGSSDTLVSPLGGDPTEEPTAAATVTATADDVSSTTLIPSVDTGSDGMTETPLLEIIQELSSDDGAAVQRAGTPQNNAYQWMTSPDELAFQARVPLSETKQLQRYNLATFYYSTGGDAVWRPTARASLSSQRISSAEDQTPLERRHLQDQPLPGPWLDSTLDDCEWEFIVCNTEGEIVSLDLIPPKAPELQGVLPPELGLLSSLNRLVIMTGDAEASAMAREAMQQLGHNQGKVGAVFRSNDTAVITPSIIMDAEAGDTEMSSSNNGMLTGPLPSELGQLTLLETLMITDQTISGRLPSEVGNMRSIKTLDLTSNQFTGSVPDVLGKLDQMTDLRLGFNSFQGTIGAGLFTHENGMAQSLKGLFLNNNFIEGNIPTEMGLLTGLETGLFLQNNQLTGMLPVELSDLRSIKVFRVENNKLTGTIPDYGQSWNAIDDFRVWGNDGLTGPMPLSMCRLFQVRGTVSYVDCALECACCEVCCVNGVCDGA